MIPRVNERSISAQHPLSQALNRNVSAEEGLTEHTVVAYWPGLEFYTLDDEQTVWSSAQWAEHLDDPLVEHPFATGPQGDRRAIFHLDVRLHPDDRDLTGPEWTEAAHRLARAAGIEIPGDESGCRWIGVQAQPGRLDLIANLIRLDGTWQSQPASLLRRLSDEARRIENELHLTPVRTAPERQAVARPVPTASTQLATVLAQLADEQSGPLATVRGLIEHTAHRLARQPGAGSPGTAHRLELIAHRLLGIQQDLDASAAHLAARPTGAVPRHGIATAPPEVRHTRRSP
ncbi:relaxase/mobilization nuclease [Streptomyces zingiberis]|uniref:Relaxase/mobilization nuclease n=1 Tax=Streptomyces zingiberis TaxID=2053010 RepID=A0ABX1C5V5_9ACTN|nr:relaxase/mobilization nuclease [Streptomyces zingiberis]NJQ03327.1 relaxase/mobilization nuclease [Streptomyces zingiberis]